MWGDDGVGRCARRVARGGPERGDVPGWVLVTLMTAGLVTALWVIAGDALGRVFEDAIASVTGALTGEAGSAIVDFALVGGAGHGAVRRPCCS